MTSETQPAAFAGRYRIEEQIAQGAASVVYRANDTTAGHPVALKVLDPRLSWDPNALERLRREVVVSRRVQHPGVVRVHDLVTDGDRAAVVQELVEGASLAELIARQGPLPVARTVGVARGVLEALAACHEKGILHRDLKPSNVLLEAGDRVRLIDFGIAKVGLLTTVTHTGAVLGTPGYQAPEVLRGERPDLRADLYGVGILLFEMLAGQPPFPAGEGSALFRQLSEEPPEVSRIRPDVPRGLAALVRRLLDPHPEMRPAGAYEVVEALADLDLAPASAAPGPLCPDCGHTNRSNIPFCAACGRHKRIALRPGPCFVRLRGLDRAEEYERHLQALFGDVPVLRDHQAEGDPTFILARDIARETAEALVADARRFGGAGEVGTGLGWLQLDEGVSGRGILMVVAGSGLVLLGIVVMAFSMLADRTLMGPGVGSLLLGLAFFGGFARTALRSLRPVLDASHDRSSRPTRSAALAQKVAPRVARLRPGPLAEPLAMAVEAYWQARVQGRAAEGDYAKALEALLDKVFLVVERADPLVRLLEGRGPADAAKDLERIRIRRRAAGGDAHELARLEGAVADEVAALEEADDLVSVAAGRLVLAAGLFRRQARQLATAKAVPSEELALQEFLQHADVELEAFERVLALASPPEPVPNHRQEVR
jgi:tRNA A-37 threonylcarbamoyl transferase component Bud32